MASLYVRDLMQTEIKSINFDEPLKNASRIMINLGISSLIVVNKDNPIGIITERDLMTSVGFYHDNIHDAPIKNYMSTSLITIEDNDTIEEAIKIMYDNKIKKLPVMCLSGKRAELVGILSLTDITRNHPELLTQNRELESTIVELDSYTYTVAHDLKAPLRHIVSYGEMLKEDYSDKLDSTGCYYVERIQKSATLMNDFISDLLTLTKVDKIEKDNKFLPFIEILYEIKETLSSDNNVKIEFDDNYFLVNQAVLIKQLFSNLVSNGLKFNDSETPTINISCERNSSSTLFRIEDNGIGIKEENYSKIFNLFTRLHTYEQYPGTGAGLSICKRIVDRLEGKIWIESKVGEGSIFFIELPNSYIIQNTFSENENGVIPETTSVPTFSY